MLDPRIDTAHGRGGAVVLDSTLNASASMPTHFGPKLDGIHVPGTVVQVVCSDGSRLSFPMSSAPEPPTSPGRSTGTQNRKVAASPEVAGMRSVGTSTTSPP